MKLSQVLYRAARDIVTNEFEACISSRAVAAAAVPAGGGNAKHGCRKQSRYDHEAAYTAVYIPWRFRWLGVDSSPLQDQINFGRWRNRGVVSLGDEYANAVAQLHCGVVDVADVHAEVPIGN